MAVVRAAMTQTVNAYRDMPATTAGLPALADKLGAIREANLEHHRQLAARAARAGVQLLGLGELFPAPYFALESDPMWLAMAEDAVSGASVTAMCEVARRYDLVVVAPIYELDPRSGHRFDTAVVIDRGAILGKYRKTHIPAGTNDCRSFCERDYYQASDGDQNHGAAAVTARNPYFPVFATSLGKLGVAICYDRHFEGVFSTLARGGAEIVLSPAVTFGSKSRRMWELEFPVEAARHNLFVGGSNRLGREPPWNQDYFGASYFCGPNGRLDDLGDDPRLVIADLDLDELRRPDPSGWQLQRDARDIFGNG